MLDTVVIRINGLLAMFLTTWHMLFAAFMTQVLARTTPYLDSRHKVPMTPQKYMCVGIDATYIAPYH
jgi:hypothetical protein